MKAKLTKKDRFFSRQARLGLALSYDDVRLRTDYTEVLPADIDLSTAFSRRVPLMCPIVSPPMDTVTEHKLATELAKNGGLGIIHRVLSPHDQAAEVARVKFHLNGLIGKPICVNQNATMAEILELREVKGYSFHSFLVVDSNNRLVGLLTNNDFDFCTNKALKARQVMSRELITAREGVSLVKAFKIMTANKKKVLPILKRNGDIAGMYVFSDVKRIIEGGSPLYNLDKNGNLRVGAAVGTGDDALVRTETLVRKGVDVVVIDTAHGDSRQVLETLKEIKRNYPELDVVVGNISEGEAARRLVRAGADGIKVGQGPGSICTTRIVAGIGCPQVTAVYNCAKAIRGSGVPVCADGGLRYSGDITIALGAGAWTVMPGNLLAGTKETPGEVIIRQGVAVKEYRGMGSLAAMQASSAARERYGQIKSEKSKLVPEGVEGVVPFKGEVAAIIYQCLGGLRSGMGYVGAKTIPELQRRADFYRLSGSGLAESHPHGLVEIKDAPNYQPR